MKFDQPVLTSSAQETRDFGRRIAEHLLDRIGERPRIICLYGELGSGKTTFTQGFARGLGIKGRLLSPTFIIVRRYQLPKSSGFLYHVDLYRLQTTDELEELGFSEIFADPHAFVVIEWAEKLGSLLPKHRIDIQFSIEGDTHNIQVHHY